VSNIKEIADILANGYLRIAAEMCGKDNTRDNVPTISRGGALFSLASSADQSNESAPEHLGDNPQK